MAVRTDDIKKAWASLKRRFRSAREARYPRAFPSDTYLADLAQSARSRKTWLRTLPLIVLVTVFADFYLLQDAFAWMLGSASLTDVLASGSDGAPSGSSAVGTFFSLFLCVALVLVYLALGKVAGKKLSEYRAFHRGSSFASFVVFALAGFAVLFFIAFVRYCSILDELAAMTATSSFGGGGFGATAGTASGGFGAGGFGSGGFGGSAEDLAVFGLDVRFSPRALVQTLGLVSVMFLGAFLEMIHSYHSLDPYAEEKRSLAESYLAEDRRLYESVYAQWATDPEKSRTYEREERVLDRAAVDCAFRVSELATQLNAIVDPADAYDFCKISRLMREECPGWQTERKGEHHESKA